MKQRKRSLHRQWLIPIGVTVIALLVIFTISRFVMQVQQSEMKIADNNLKVASNNCAAQVRTTFDTYFKVLYAMGTALRYEKDLRELDMASLQEIAELNGGVRISLDFPDGTTRTSDGLTGKAAGSQFFQGVEAGNSSVSDVLEDEFDGVPVVYVSVPVKDSAGNTSAALRMTVTTGRLNSVINMILFDTEGYYHIIDENGKYVAVDDSQNARLMDESFLSAIEKLVYEPGYTAADILGAFQGGDAGYSRYSAEGSQRYAYYERIGINDWVLMMIVPREVVVRQEQQTIYLAVLMALRLTLVVLLIFLYVIYVQKQARVRMELSDKCFRALTEQSGKVIFEWDFAEEKLVTSSRFERIFGRALESDYRISESIAAGAVHPEDAETYRKAFSAITHGSNIENAVYRIKHLDGSYHWCRLSGVVVADQRGRPYRAIGSLEDIHETVCKEAELKQKSEKDQLTNIYNKITTEYLIKQALADPTVGPCALLIIDIDNFKQVNDAKGHQFGDTVLIELAKMIQPLFRSSDVVGRIGGDEFFVFMQSFTSMQILENKAAEICRIFRSLNNEETVVCPISASIGIALYQKDAETFEDLYRCADLALYATKKKGKNGFSFYDSLLTPKEFSNKRTAIEST